MMHLRATSVVQLPPKRQEMSKSSHEDSFSRTISRHGMVVACLLLASHLVGATLKPLYTSRGLSTNIQEFVGKLNATKVVANDGSPPVKPSGLSFMKGKNLFLVTSPSGGPLLSIELGSILLRSGAYVHWNEEENYL